MNTLLSKVPGIDQATPAEKLEMIDELWESVRRSDGFVVPPSHVSELERRVSAVIDDPSLALSPQEARALLRK